MTNKKEKIEELKEKISKLQDELKNLEKRKTLKENMQYSFNYYYSQAMVACSKATQALLLASDKAEGEGDQEVADLVRETVEQIKALLQPLWGSSVIHDLLQEDKTDINQNSVDDNKEILLGSQEQINEAEGTENNWNELSQRVIESFVENYLGKGIEENDIYKFEGSHEDVEKDSSENPERLRGGGKGFIYKKYLLIFDIFIKETNSNSNIEISLEEGGTGTFEKALGREEFVQNTFESNWNNITIEGDAVTVTEGMKNILNNKFNKKQ